MLKADWGHKKTVCGPIDDGLGKLSKIRPTVIYGKAVLLDVRCAPGILKKMMLMMMMMMMIIMLMMIYVQCERDTGILPVFFDDDDVDDGPL